MDSLMLETAQIVVESVDNITTRSRETSKPGNLCLTVGLGSFAILVPIYHIGKNRDITIYRGFYKNL